MDVRGLGFDPSPPPDPDPLITEAQVRMIYSIARNELQMGQRMADDLIHEWFGKASARELSRLEATDAIDQLHEWSVAGGYGVDYR